MGALTSQSYTCRGLRGLQPADGSCLYHSLTSELLRILPSTHVPTPPANATELRKVLTSFVIDNKNLNYGGNTWNDWVLMHSEGLSPEAYAAKMTRETQWGGEVEIAACCVFFNVNIWVYQRISTTNEEYKRTVEYIPPNSNPSSFIAHLVFVNANHYDVFQPFKPVEVAKRSCTQVCRPRDRTARARPAREAEQQQKQLEREPKQTVCHARSPLSHPSRSCLFFYFPSDLLI